ncbi:hypothetical protein Tco_0950734 [Tanacetum coccineum]
MAVRTQLTLSLVQKRYRGTSELILDTDSEWDKLRKVDTKEDGSSNADDEREGQGLDDEGHGLDGEGHGLDDEGQGLDDEGRGLDEEGQGLEDEGPGMEEEEETAHVGHQQAVLVVDTAASEPLGLGYGAARQRAIESTEEITPSTYEPTLVTRVDPEDGRVYTDIPNYVPLAAPVQTPPSPEWSLGSLPVSPSPVVSSPIASPVATPAATISVDED